MEICKSFCNFAAVIKKEHVCMNIYSLLKYYRRIKSPRIKLLGILVLHVLRRRYLYISMDPSLSCNFRCRMCFFSNPEIRAQMKDRFSQEDIHAFANALFHRALKIQIGCGAEPLTFSGLPELVKLASEKGIANISVTTNGSLLTREKLQQLIDHGLTEIILSAHGLSKPVYEYMMPGANYEHFLLLVRDISDVKKKHPKLLFRINYTVCEKNIDDLKLIPSLFKEFTPDVIQLRPVQDIGGIYNNYSMASIMDKYTECIVPVVQFCEARGITCIYPQINHLEIIDDENGKKSHLNAVVDMLPCINVSPYDHWKEEFNPYMETFEDYARRTSRVSRIWKMFLGLNSASENETVTHALNYDVK